MEVAPDMASSLSIVSCMMEALSESAFSRLVRSASCVRTKA